MDINVRAFRTVHAALAEPAEPDKRRESSRKGGLRGGKARAASLSKERKKQIALSGSVARWGNVNRKSAEK